MHYDILGDPFFRDHDVDAHARIVDGARSRRHLGARGAGELSRAKRRGQEAALAAADLTGLMTAYRAAWVCPIDQPPIKDGIVAIDGGTDRRGRDQGSGIAPDQDVHGSRQRRAPAGPGQRAHPSRAVVAARPRAAGGAVHRLGEDAVRDSRPARRAACRRSRSRRFARRFAKLQATRHGGGRRHQQFAGGGRADAGGRVSTAWSFTSCLASRSATARW